MKTAEIQASKRKNQVKQENCEDSRREIRKHSEYCEELFYQESRQNQQLRDLFQEGELAHFIDDMEIEQRREAHELFGALEESEQEIRKEERNLEEEYEDLVLQEKRAREKEQKEQKDG